MKIKNKLKTLNMFLAVSLVFALPFATMAIKADVIPVIPLDSSRNTFTPTSMGNTSLYIVEPGYESPGIFYSGKSAGVEYTENADTGTSIGTGSDTLTDGEFVDPIDAGDLISTETRTRYNPFFEDEIIPVLVNISEKDVQLYNTNPTPLSLHMGNSLTFFFNASLEYYALINTSDPFFLDVHVLNPNAEINFDLTNTIHPRTVKTVADLVTGTEKQSFPIIPSEMGLQEFRIYQDNGISSIVTLSPLPFNIDQFGTTEIPEGQFFTDVIEQGECQKIEDDARVVNELELLDMQFFQFPVEAGNTYQVYFYQKDIYDASVTIFSVCTPGALNAVHLDFDDSFGFVDGSLTNSEKGRVVHALEDGFVNVSIIATGLVFKDYSFFFREANEIHIPEELPLTLNQPVVLKESPDYFYTFTLAQPSMMAINYTDAPGLTYNFVWSLFDSELDEYVQVSTSEFSPEDGNLLNDTGDDLFDNPGGTNYNWIYLPAGDYKLEVTGDNLVDGEFQFNTVQVQSFTNSIDLTVNPNSIFAVELPINPIYHNFINMSTLSQNNLSVTYEYAIIGKYSTVGTSDTVPNYEAPITLGNQEVAGNWTAYPNNDTTIRTYVKPTQSNFVPILLVRPYFAVGLNQSGFESSVASYTTTLTVSSNINENYTPSTTVYGLTGYQIGVPGIVSTETTVPVNDDYTNDDDQVFAFTLSTTPSQLYNLTVYLTGNYSMGAGVLNATFDDATSVFVHSGNFQNTNVFGGLYYWETNFSAFHSQLFFSVAPQSYLFVDVERFPALTLPRENATLTVVLTPITVAKLNLVSNIDDLLWNETVSEFELADTEPLWNITDYTYPSGGGLDLFPVLVLVGVGGVVIVGGAGVVALRRRRGVSGKFP
jgi:hypothetical protein